MAPPLLQTKLYIPPPRPELVPRPRLIERLNGGLHRKLTLVSAPAGFGKTTLVSEWIHAVEAHRPFQDASSDASLHVAWLSIDEGDNDLSRFLIYLTGALQTVWPDIGKGVSTALQSPQPPPAEAILSSLINEIAAHSGSAGRTVLVLDDYHLIDVASPGSAAIHDALAFLLRRLPPATGSLGGLHTVIATREDPPLPLARLRARGQLTELRATDLRFTSSEASTFLNQTMGLAAMGLDLSREDITALEARTEGWIAGLQLAALAMQGALALQAPWQGRLGHGESAVTGFIQSFTGSHRFVLDYLLEEVLEQQPDSVQAFLLHTAVLDRLTGTLCDVLLRQEDGQRTLEMLERANLFVFPLDEERRWYRYHHLFADLLRQRLRQKQPDSIPTLHTRASEWYEQNGFVDEAIEHALRGEYWERAATLIEKHFGDNYERGDQTLLQRWLTEMPEELVLSRPSLCILHAWNLFSLGKLDAADRRLQAAAKMLSLDTDQRLDSSPDKDQLSGTKRMELVGRVAAIQSFLVSYSGDVAGTIQYARQALEYLPEQELVWRGGALITLGDAYASQGQMAAAHKARSDALVVVNASDNIYISLIVNLNLADTLRQQGKLSQVVDICERQLKMANESGISESALVGWLLGIRGEVLAELNDLDRAIDQAKKGVKLATLGGDVIHIASSNLNLVRVLFSRGDLVGAQDVIQSMEDLTDEYDLPSSALLQLSAWQVRIWLAQGKLETASQWARERELDPDGELYYLHEMEYIVFARILIAQGRLDEAIALLQRLLKAAEAGGRTWRVIEILVLQALTCQAKGDTVRAIAALESALTLTEPEGFIRMFVDEGPPMARLLYEALNRRIAPDYTRRLLAAFPLTRPESAAEPEQAAPLETHSLKPHLIEPLSQRELEVLELIAEGLTNPEIAARLFLSLYTIKAHTRNIYGKLDVHNRTQAVSRARGLGILPST